MADLLVIDSDRGEERFYRESLAALGRDCVFVPQAQEALHLLNLGRTFDAVLLLWELDGTPSGPELLLQLRRHHPTLPVLIVNGQADLQRLARARALGASASALKPLSLDRLRALLAAAAPPDRQSALLKQLRERAVGEDREFVETLRRVARLIPLPSEAVLLTGENGTGKEVLARALHDLGPESAGPWIAVNVASLPESLMESELFGHEAGAFTDAKRTHAGCFERAENGTLFLDEIGELRTDLQPKLLRVVQERHFRRVGGSEELPWRARLICATNRNLLQEVQAGRFRMDLYYRIATHECRLPPLRFRGGDIDLLADHFLREQGSPFSLGDDARALLRQYTFPGNVRELAGLLHQAAAQCYGDTIGINDLPVEAMWQRTGGRDLPEGAGWHWPERLFALTHREAMAEIEREFNRTYLPRKLLEADGVQRRAAELAELDPKTFRTKAAAAQSRTAD